MIVITKLVGVLSFAIGVGSLVLSGYYALRLEGDTAWAFFFGGGGALVSGTTLYCLGAITEHLQQIETISKEQAELLRKRLPTSAAR